MIVLSDIAKTYETTQVYTHALRDVSLRIEAGEYLSIRGASGSGKSTLLNVIGLLEQTSGGSYCFDGRDMASLSPSMRATCRARQVGFVFQSFNLLGELTALDNVMLPTKFARSSTSEGERRQEAARVLGKVGLAARAGHYPAQLSGGQQQRVAIARAIVNRPRIILADEPTGNLDSATGQQIMDLLDELHQAGTTLLVVTHDARLAERAGRQIAMADGQIDSDSAAQLPD